MQNNKELKKYLGILLSDRDRRMKRQTLVCLQSEKQDQVHYSRFAISSFEKGEAQIVGIALRKGLLNIKGTFVTRVTFENLDVEDPHASIPDLKEQISEILENFKKLLIRNFSFDSIEASISVSGPREVTAKDIALRNLPFDSNVKVVNQDQHLFTVVEPKDIKVDLLIERDFLRIDTPHKNEIDDSFYLSKLWDRDKKIRVGGSFGIEMGSPPVRQVNYTIHPFEGNKELETLFIEIWTNRSLLPNEALMKAAMTNATMFQVLMKGAFPHFEEFFQKDFEQTVSFPLTMKHILFQKDREDFQEEELVQMVKETDRYLLLKLDELIRLTARPTVQFDFHSWSIEQFEWSPLTYFNLKDANFHLVGELLNDFCSNFKETKNFEKESKREIATFLVWIVDRYLGFLQKKKEDGWYIL